MNFVYVCPESEDLKHSIEMRCAAPARVINRTGRYSADLIGWRDFALNSPTAMELLDRSDYIIIHRGLWASILPRIQHWKARDKTIIADFRDAYQLMEPDELVDVYDMEVNGGLQAGDSPERQIDLLTQLKWTLQATHGATTPSKRLCDDWNAYTRSLVVPDYLDLDRLNLIVPQEHDQIVLGWQGSVRRIQSMKKSGILMAFQAACQMRKNIKFLLFVDHPEAVDDLGLPPEQLEVIGWNSPGGWNRQLSRIDIGLSSMVGEFEQRCSCSQLLEFMALKIPWIASQGAAVYDMQSYGWIVENTAESWLKATIEMIDHLDDYRAEAAIAPYLFAISKNLEENIQTLVDTYIRLGSLYSTRPLGSPDTKPSGQLHTPLSRETENEK
ncbi:MAG: glycosyltransferase family 4 protein [Leptolinea sp.]|nr:glycosyltransferase family 4 protein [Leptolinea sp.]